MLNDESHPSLSAAAAAASALLPVAVLGAGPVGLAAVANLVRRGMPFVLLEAAETVGASLLEFGHVRLFSPWRYNVDPTMAEMLGRDGWTAPPEDELPLAREIVDRVLRPFAALADIAPFVKLQTKVIAISREGFDKVKSEGRAEAPFVIHAVERGAPIELRARAVIDATGTWQKPNPLGASGPWLSEKQPQRRRSSMASRTS